MGNTYYTGIGSRRCPTDILMQMHSFGVAFASINMTLRSGGAPGADMAFEQGCNFAPGKKQIFLPWKGFNDNPSKYHNVHEKDYELAKEIYGRGWSRLKEPTKKLMTRNLYQVTGGNLNKPSKFVVCWTENGEIKGGTSQAIKYAMTLDIPVFNLYNADTKDKLIEFVSEITNG